MLRRIGVGLFVWASLAGWIVVPTSAGIDLLEELSDGSTVELPILDPTVPSPADYLGYPLGHRFTHHEQIVHYLEALAAASDRVKVWKYGSTYEGRPLKLAAISSAKNLARLESIQADLMRLAGTKPPSNEEVDQILASTPVVVWLAYGVHGNEASSAEAAMAAAYVFAAAENDWDGRLDNAVILIDPLENPDGRERYVHFFETHRGRLPDPLPASAEHRESWPGGRQNHYLVDLNRDWAWLTQVETKHRVAAYRQWEPQVYVDFHEMSPQSTYFFPPPAEPVHSYISPRALYWLETFGRANASAFDNRGWVYYVGEKFDLFYPGYGDSYPSLRGAIGMTYEMAGHGRAGQVIERPDGTLLTLVDRIARHLTTSIATARSAAENHTALLTDFADARRRSFSEEERTYIWEAGQQEARAAGDLLSAHGVSVERLAQPTKLSVAPLTGGPSENREFPAGAYVVSTHQSLGTLVRTLMDLDASISESFLNRQRSRLEQNQSTEFFDITAWSLPLAYNFQAWITSATPPVAEVTESPAATTGEGNLGFLIRPKGLRTYKLQAQLQREGVIFRLALNEFRLENDTYPSGTIFLPRRGNPTDLEQRIKVLSNELNVEVNRASSGYSEIGHSLGSDGMVSIRAPRIGLVSGDGVDPTSFGFLWHLLDQQVEANHHRLSTGTLARTELSGFDVIVLPSGSGYAQELGGIVAKKLGEWVREGGVLVGVDQAASWLNSNELSAIKFWQPPKEDGKPNEVTELTPDRRQIYTPGAVLKTSYQRRHPLTAGLDRSPAVIYSGRTVMLPTGDPRQDVLVAASDNPVIAGFAWPEAKERLKGSLLVGTEVMGSGVVVTFSQEPNFRLFWRGTAPLFLNAVLYGPSLAENGHLK